MTKEMWYKVLNWIIFSVLLALVPILFFQFLLEILLTGAMPSMTDVFAEGELFLVSSMISSSAIGILFSGKLKKTIVGLLALGGSVFSLLLSAFSYAVSSGHAALLLGQAVAQPGPVAMLSLYIFVFTLITSCGCVIVAAIQPEEDTGE